MLDDSFLQAAIARIHARRRRRRLCHGLVLLLAVLAVFAVCSLSRSVFLSY